MKSFVIRDPVHGYLRIAAHEGMIVDHPVTQRLRHISQLGLAQLVYPEARTSRFAHSIGTMHLASRFVVAAIENAGEASAIAFFEDLEQLFTPLREGVLRLDELDVLLEGEASLAGTGLLSGRAMFRYDSLRKDPKFKRLLTLVEAATRLAALFHDLGHLPFSHDLEFALETFIGSSEEESLPEGLLEIAKGTPHEVIGHALAERVLSALISDQETAKSAIFKLARDILHAEAPYSLYEKPATSIEWLHSVIDGEIDVDRADYLLRDARALGFEFAAYDLDRLVNNAVLLRDEKLGFISGFNEHAIMAVESFLVSRYRSSHALIRHHKVAQVGAALRFASVEALRQRLANGFLSDLASVTKPETDQAAIRSLLERFSCYDDSYWIAILRSLTPQPGLLQASLDLVLRRAKTLRTLWKRRGELTNEELSQINAYPDTKLKGLRNALEPKGVLIAFHKFRPYRVIADGDPIFDSVVPIKTKHAGIQRLARLSPLVRSLAEAWNQEPHMHAFATGTITKQDVLAEMARLA